MAAAPRIRHYQPAIIRSPTLLFLLIIPLMLIALTEYAIRSLPAHGANGLISSRVEEIVEHGHIKRQSDGTDASDAPAIEATQPSPSDSEIVQAASPPQADYMPLMDGGGNVKRQSDDTDASNDDDSTTDSSQPSSSDPEVQAASPQEDKYMLLTDSGGTVKRQSDDTDGSSMFAYLEHFSSPDILRNLLTKPDDDDSTTESSESSPDEAGVSKAASEDKFMTLGKHRGTHSLQNRVRRDATLSTSISSGKYVLGAFVPTILGVLFSIPWKLVVTAVKEMEPFYQLHASHGVPAEDSLTLDYRASMGLTATITAMQKGHFRVWWTGLVSFMVLFIAPLASETVFIGFVESSICTATSGRENCFPELSVFPPAIRAIQGILAVVAVMTGGLLLAFRRVRSGVLAKPLSIASLATLFQHQPLVDLFNQMDSTVPSTKQLRTALHGVRCRIGEYVNEIDGSMAYGIYLVSSHGQPMEAASFQVALNAEKKYATVSVAPIEDVCSNNETKRSVSGTHPIMVTIFGALICGLMTLIIYYKQVGTDTGFERFLDGQSFGVFFLFTALGIMIKLYWGLMEDETRLMEPYRDLQQGLAHPRDSILLAPHSNPFTGVFYSLRHGQFFSAFYSLVAILCDVLTVCLANIPFKPDSVFVVYTTATWLSTGIMGLILVGIVWRAFRRSAAKGIRRPDTIAGMMFQISGSHMLDDFAGMALLTKRTRDNTIRSWGKRYTMGNLIGTDGVQRMRIDEDMSLPKTGAQDTPRLLI